MRVIALLAAAIILLSTGPAIGEQAAAIEAFDRWRLACSPRDRAVIAWAQADGTVATPDI